MLELSEKGKICGSVEFPFNNVCGWRDPRHVGNVIAMDGTWKGSVTWQYSISIQPCLWMVRSQTR